MSGQPIPHPRPPDLNTITISLDTMETIIKSGMVYHKDGVTEESINDASRTFVAALSGALKRRYPDWSAKVGAVIDCVDEEDKKYLSGVKP
jgi:hypothetical protein